MRHAVGALNTGSRGPQGRVPRAQGPLDQDLGVSWPKSAGSLGILLAQRGESNGSAELSQS